MNPGIPSSSDQTAPVSDIWTKLIFTGNRAARGETMPDAATDEGDVGTRRVTLGGRTTDGTRQG